MLDMTEDSDLILRGKLWLNFSWSHLAKHSRARARGYEQDTKA